METYQMAAAAAAAALLILAVRGLRKKRKADRSSHSLRKRHGKTGKETMQPVPVQDEGQAAGPVRTAGTGRQQVWTNTCDGGRTMLLSYTTLILTDVEHPARTCRAELFHPVTVGRDRDCDIVLEEASVSRKHLRVYREGALVYVENLSMVNQTLLNGRILKTPAELVSGSRLKIGRYCFQVEID